MELLGRYSAWLEVSSIDEAFLGVKGTPKELLALGRDMKEPSVDLRIISSSCCRPI
jgi:DNA polymerase V